MTTATSSYLNRPRRSLVEALAQRCVDAFQWYGPTYAEYVFAMCVDTHPLTLEQQAQLVDQYRALILRKH